MTARIRTVDFDRLATSVPLNKQAAQDYNATGEAPQSRDRGPCEVFLAPPAGRPTPSGVQDFAGCRFGNAKSIHLRARQPGDGKNRVASWVMRCDCANFYLRNHRRLVETPPGAPIEECPVCTRDRAALSRGKGADRKLRHVLREARKAAS